MLQKDPVSHACVLAGETIARVRLSFFGVFKTGFLCVALAVLELTLKTRLALNSEIRQLLPPSAGIKGVRHHTWPSPIISNQPL